MCILGSLDVEAAAFEVASAELQNWNKIFLYSYMQLLVVLITMYSEKKLINKNIPSNRCNFKLMEFPFEFPKSPFC